jgi:hypothetical protein
MATRRAGPLVFVLTLAACGGGGAPNPGGAPGALSGTLAYVTTECREDARGIGGSQALHIRRGESEPVTVVEHQVPEPVPDPFGGLCSQLGELIRYAPGNGLFAAAQRLGVSPDGSAVVFEITDDFSVFAPNKLVAPDQEGFFFVRSDGRGLRRLGPASRDPDFGFVLDPSQPFGFRVSGPFLNLAFSPDGHTVAYTDRGPGPTGEDVPQIVTLDVATGQRTQLTHLPRATPPDPVFVPTGFPFFLDDETIVFRTFANPDGLNPQGDFIRLTVKIDEPHLLKVFQVPLPVVLPGSEVVPLFAITGAQLDSATFSLDGPPMNHIPSLEDRIQEVFGRDGENLLQLTNFARVDTFDQFASVDGQRVFFTASADPLGTNPSENCQLFSIDRLGTDLRQLTSFREAEHSARGCTNLGPPPGCNVSNVWQDTVTQTVVFHSGCDPFGTKGVGEIFAMGPDGTGLRQLTRGSVSEADGTVVVLGPGPFVYQAAP